MLNVNSLLSVVLVGQPILDDEKKIAYETIWGSEWLRLTDPAEQIMVDETVRD